MLEDVHFNGWFRDPEDPRDYQAVFSAGAQLPRQVDLRPRCSPVENQRHIGSCVANAVVGAAEYLEAIATGSNRPPDLSRLFVYFNARYLHGAQMKDSGTYVRAAMASLTFYGVCLESIWPYDPSRYAQPPSAEAYRDAQKRQGLEYARIRPGDEIKQALAAGFPVAFGTAIPKACYVQATNGGRLPMPDSVPQDEIVGHAMLLVGYDLDQGHYIIRNSWGEEWGDRGYCYAPLALIDTYPHSTDFWVLRRLEQDGSFEMIRPTGAGASGRTCPACGAAVSPGAKFCSACGKPLPPEAPGVPGMGAGTAGLPSHDGSTTGVSGGGAGSLLDEIDRRREQARQNLDRRLEENRRRLQEDIDRLLGRGKKDG